MRATKIVVILGLVLGLAAKVAKADFTFGEPMNLGPTVNSSANEGSLSVSADGLELYFGCLNRPGGYGQYDIWVAKRDTVEDDWGTPMNLGPIINNSSGEVGPDISSDGLTLYFVSNRAGGFGSNDLWVTTRATVNGVWGEPVNLGPAINSTYTEATPNVSADGLVLFFTSDRLGGYGSNDIWVATRASLVDDWGIPVNFGPTINSSNVDNAPELSADGLAFFFASTDRPGGYGGRDIWLTRRPTANDPWGEPVNLGPIINSPSTDAGASLSGDGSSLYFTSNRPGGFGSRDLYQASIIPIVDLNADGIVDADDMCIIVDHWGTDNSLCDIGPRPWGDGIVDVQDLIVLAEHLFEEIPPAE